MFQDFSEPKGFSLHTYNTPDFVSPKTPLSIPPEVKNLGTIGTLEQNLYINDLRDPYAQNSGTNTDSMLYSTKLRDTLQNLTWGFNAAIIWFPK